MLIGAPRHPESDSKDSLRHELATMTSHDDWVLAHSFVVASTLLLAAGLWLAYRYSSWPARLHRALFGTALVVSAYVVETVFHLASAVDSDELHHGDAAPVAFTHVGLSIVLYPVTGFAIAYLSARIFATVQLRRKPIAVLGVAAGVLHGVSVPLTADVSRHRVHPGVRRRGDAAGALVGGHRADRSGPNRERAVTVGCRSFGSRLVAEPVLRCVSPCTRGCNLDVFDRRLRSLVRYAITRTRSRRHRPPRRRATGHGVVSQRNATEQRTTEATDRGLVRGGPISGPGCDVTGVSAAPSRLEQHLAPVRRPVMQVVTSRAQQTT